MKWTSDFIQHEVACRWAISIKERVFPSVKVLRVEVLRETGLINRHVFRHYLRRYCGCTINTTDNTTNNTTKFFPNFILYFI